MADLVISMIAGRYGFVDLLILPNVLMRDRPEVYTFSSNEEVFLVESGSGGIMGHAHELMQKFDVPTKVDGARVYFTVCKEYLHYHHDEATIYYIAKVDGVYQVFDLATRTAVTSTHWGAGHYHGLRVRDVFQKK
jgi:hypothetical protein